MPPKRKAAKAGKKDPDTSNGDAKEVKKSIQDKMKKTKSVGKKSSSKVDPNCPVGTGCEIFKEGGESWDCMLNQTNIQNNNNKYFLLQLLVDNSKDVYHTWFRWGRVGYNGQNALQRFHDLDAAKSHFKKKFSDKTKNDWEDRDNFEKVPGKYDLVDIQVATEDDDVKDEVDEPAAKKKKKKQKVLESQLNAKVKELIEMICDKKIMEQTLKGLDFDVDKAPLGKVTADQIKAGYKALSDIAAIVNDEKKAKNKKSLLEACNEFYTRIPHFFGMRVPPMIKTIEEIKSKIELLEALNDIQLGIKVMDDKVKDEKEDEDVAVRNPVDIQYDNLNIKLEPLDHKDDEFKLLERCIQSTHGSTHMAYKMDVKDIFTCEKSSLPFSDKGNRMLLFHGSRLSNFAGILSQGLRIAPPEAPVTGYMFGKGCYFADMSSKSANYCFATPSKPEGLMLLCEVTLGKENELLQADYNADKLPKGKHSVKGLGRTSCDPENYEKLEDGTIVPMGPGKTTPVPGGSLMYNEYIVYNTNQIRLRYLAKINFNFKY